MKEIVQVIWKSIGKNDPESEEFLNTPHCKCTEVIGI